MTSQINYNKVNNKLIKCNVPITNQKKFVFQHWLPTSVINKGTHIKNYNGKLIEIFSGLSLM